MKCKKCKNENSEKENFCKNCGAKSKEICNCWVLKKDNYNCGESSCPGYALLSNEVQRKEGTPCHILKKESKI
ncbi:MAG: hypothetical protein ACOX1S_05485 [Anaerostipes sp.]|jgi:hypothetical protein